MVDGAAQPMRESSKIAAIGGVTAALAVLIMCMGTLIPVATFVCPMLCIVLLQVVYRILGRRAAWAWYAAVAVLAGLLAGDKEAAAVFICLGYYPIVKPRLDSMRWPWLWKGLLFNVAISVMYACLIYLLGMTALGEEFQSAGLLLGAVMLLLGNTVFFLLDRLLSRRR